MLDCLLHRTSNSQSLILDRLCDDAVETKCIQKHRVWSLKESVSYASRLCSGDDLPTPRQLKSHLEARYGSTIQFLDRRLKSTLILAMLLKIMLFSGSRETESHIS